MARYRLVDEPRAKPWGEKIIVNPVLVLLAAILLRVVLILPFFAGVWLPLVWLTINGVALGSFTLKREVAAMGIGIAAWFSMLFGGIALAEGGVFPVAADRVVPYIRILLSGIFFLTLYVVILSQSRSYQLYLYARGTRS